MSLYDDAQSALTILEQLEKVALPIAGQTGMSQVATDAIEALRTIFATAFGGAQVTPDTIDADARAAIQLKFPDK